MYLVLLTKPRSWLIFKGEERGLSVREASFWERVRVSVPKMNCVNVDMIDGTNIHVPLKLYAKVPMG